MGAVVNTGQHDQRRDRRQRKGGRQQHRDGGGRAEAGQHANGGAEKHAEQAIEQVGQSKGGFEAQAQVAEDFHVDSFLKAEPVAEYRHRQAERLDEDRYAEHGHTDGQVHGRKQAEFDAGIRADHHQQDHGGQQAGAAHDGAEQQHGNHDQHDFLAGEFFNRLAGAEHRAPDGDRADDGKQRTEDGREVGGTHAACRAHRIVTADEDCGQTEKHENDPGPEILGVANE